MLATKTRQAAAGVGGALRALSAGGEGERGNACLMQKRSCWFAITSDSHISPRKLMSVLPACTAAYVGRGTPPVTAAQPGPRTRRSRMQGTTWLQRLGAWWQTRQQAAVVAGAGTGRGAAEVRSMVSFSPSLRLFLKRELFFQSMAAAFLNNSL